MAYGLPTNQSDLPPGTLPDVEWPIAGGSELQEFQDLNLKNKYSVIPVCYGKCCVKDFSPSAIAYNGNNLVLRYIVCMGEIDEYIDFKVSDDITISGSNVNATVSGSGILITQYRGTTSQGVDPTLSGCMANYEDDCVISTPHGDIGVAYIVTEIPPNALGSFPNLSIILKARKVYDPRSGNTEYSNNPSLCTADFIGDKYFGSGETINNTQLEIAANANDVLIGSEKSRVMSLVMDQRQDASSWEAILKTYSSCFINRGESGVELIPNTTWSGTTLTYNEDDIISLSNLKITSANSQPTVVKVNYTNTTVTPWRTDEAVAQAAGVPLGTLAQREQSISLLGINRYSQAIREAIERLNRFQLNTISFTIEVYDKALKTKKGDVIHVTHSVGVEGEFRVTNIKTNNKKMFTYYIDCFQYNDSVFSSLCLSDPSLTAYNTNDGVVIDYENQVTGDNLPALGADVTPPLPSDEDLVCYLSCNAGSGVTVLDESGNGNNGTSISESWGNGVSGKCLEFDGIYDYVTMSGLTISGSQVTVSMWVKSTQNGDRHYLFDGYPDRFNFCWNTTTANKLGLYDSSSWQHFGDAPNDGAWHHLVFLLNDTTAKCYIDSTQFGSDLTITAINWNLATQVKLGSYYFNVNCLYEGKIDEFRIYEKILTEPEIKALYLNPGGLSAPIPWGHDSDASKIDGGKIHANTIIAEAINTSTLSAITANLGTITAGTVTGALLRTSSESTRIEMNNSDNRLKIYRSGNLIGYFGRSGDGSVLFINNPSTLGYIPVYILSARVNSNVFKITSTSTTDTGAYPVAVITANSSRKAALFVEGDTSSSYTTAPLYVWQDGTGDIIYTVPNGAHLTNGGVWTDGSSVTLKENFEDFTALDSIKTLNIKKYNYISERRRTYEEVRQHVLFRWKKIKYNRTHTQYSYTPENLEKINAVVLDSIELQNAEKEIPQAYEDELNRPVPKHTSPMAEDLHTVFGVGDEKSISAKDLAGIAIQAIKELTTTVSGLNNRIAELEGKI